MISPAPLRHRDTLLKASTAVGFTALASGLAAMVLLHATSGLNPAFDVISIHLYTPLGWLLPVSLGLFALGASAFALAARASGAPRWLSALLFVWSGCIALVALFPTDPPTASEYSPVHFVHRYAAFAAFCTMAGLGLAFSRWSRRTERCPELVARAVAACSWVAIVSLFVTSLPYGLDFVGAEAPWWADAAGFNQRMTVGSELVALAFLGGWLRRDSAEAVAAPARSVVRERVLAA
ncbi:DUF998 domain-containing protein [Glycomyces sp. L485]|uniref:DUF998 domain-containing protein n=1 Tax=Glycomyces sp. L485 TaxID=2909235 RepID=UPI001F4B08EB|nr:DUF998 domain-containing protein [Glycomyces sp. L485]MCH7230702.1 DUF998 domain-containing protein [Glycomyces sp. L485]